MPTYLHLNHNPLKANSSILGLSSQSEEIHVPTDLDSKISSISLSTCRRPALLPTREAGSRMAIACVSGTNGSRNETKELGRPQKWFLSGGLKRSCIPGDSAMMPMPCFVNP